MDNEPLTTKLNEIFKDDNALQKFLIHLLIRNKKILSFSINLEDKTYEDINDIIRIEDNIGDRITIIINCKGSGIRENNKSIVEVNLSMKLIEGNKFCVTRDDTMATNDGEAHYELPGSKIKPTTFSTTRRFTDKIFEY